MSIISSSSYAALSTAASQVPSMTTEQLIQCLESIEHPNKDRFLEFLQIFHVNGESFSRFTTEQLAQLAEDNQEVTELLLVLQGKDPINSPVQLRRRIPTAYQVFSQLSSPPTEAPQSVRIGDGASFMDDDEYWETRSLDGSQSEAPDSDDISDLQGVLWQNVALSSLASTESQENVEVDQTSLAAAIDSGSTTPPEAEQTMRSSVPLSPIITFQIASDLSPFDSPDIPVRISSQDDPHLDFDNGLAHLASQGVLRPGAMEEDVDFDRENLGPESTSGVMGSEAISVQRFNDTMDGYQVSAVTHENTQNLNPESEADVSSIALPPCIDICEVDTEELQDRDAADTDKSSYSKSIGLQLETGTGPSQPAPVDPSTSVLHSIAHGSDSDSGSIHPCSPDLALNQSPRVSGSHDLCSDRGDATSIHSSSTDLLTQQSGYVLPLDIDIDDFQIDLYSPEAPDAALQLPQIPIESLAESVDRGLASSAIHASHQRNLLHLRSRSLDGHTFFSQRNTVPPMQKRKYCDIAIQTEKSSAERRAEKLETRVKQLEHEIRKLKAESAKKDNDFGSSFISFFAPSLLETEPYISAGGWYQGYDRYI